MMSRSMNMDHYVWSTSQGGIAYSADVWMMDGFIMKSVMAGNGYTTIITMTGTNINMTTSP